MFEARIAELGIVIPEVPAPIAAYVPAVKAGEFVFTSGQLPTVDGKLIATGIVGTNLVTLISKRPKNARLKVELMRWLLSKAKSVRSTTSFE